MSEIIMKCKGFSFGAGPGIRVFPRFAAILGFSLVAFSSHAIRAQDDSDATPAPKHHRHHKAAATVSATPDADADATPKPKKKKAGFHAPAEKASPTPEEEEATPSPTPTATPQEKASKASAAPDATLSTGQLLEFNDQPGKVRRLLQTALDLTTKNLTYSYGSADPGSGGMDCSGFVYLRAEAEWVQGCAPERERAVPPGCGRRRRFTRFSARRAIRSSWMRCGPGTSFSGRAPTQPSTIRR